MDIYNNNGFGFLEDVIASKGYQVICDRIQTYVPQTSFFDLALERAKRWLTNAGELIHTLRSVDDETSDMIERTLKLLGQNILRTAAMQVMPKQKLKLPSVFGRHEKEDTMLQG